MSAPPIDLDALERQAKASVAVTANSPLHGVPAVQVAALVRAVRAAQALYAGWPLIREAPEMKALHEALAPFAAPAAPPPKEQPCR